MRRLLLAITCSVLTVAAASPHSEGNRPSSFEIRELRSEGEVHEVFPCTNAILHQTKSQNLAASAALDARALESALIRPLTGVLAGYFDIDVVLTGTGAIAYERFCAASVGKGAWAYLLSGNVVAMYKTTYHTFAEHPPVGITLHAMLTEAEAQQYAAAIKSEIESLRH
jgi:hypothetical protein